MITINKNDKENKDEVKKDQLPPKKNVVPVRLGSELPQKHGKNQRPFNQEQHDGYVKHNQNEINKQCDTHIRRCMELAQGSDTTLQIYIDMIPTTDFLFIERRLFKDYILQCYEDIQNKKITKNRSQVKSMFRTEQEEWDLPSQDIENMEAEEEEDLEDNR